MRPLAETPLASWATVLPVHSSMGRLVSRADVVDVVDLRKDSNSLCCRDDESQRKSGTFRARRRCSTTSERQICTFKRNNQ